MKKIIVLLHILIFNCKGLVAQNNYWEKAEAKYNSDYRERIRTNMYSKPKTYSSPSTTTTNNSSSNNNSWSDNSNYNRKMAIETKAEIEKKNAALRAEARKWLDSNAAAEPIRLEQKRKRKELSDFIQSNGITAQESKKIADEFYHFDELIIGKKHSPENIEYYKNQRENYREQIYIGDYKKAFMELKSNAPYDTLSKILNILTNNGAPLTAFELIKELKIKYPNQIDANNNAQIKIYQVLFTDFTEDDFLNPNGFIKNTFDSYLAFENTDINLYAKMLVCLLDNNGRNPYETMLDKINDALIYADTKSEKKEVKEYYEIYSSRQKKMNNKVEELIQNANPTTLQEQIYFNKLFQIQNPNSNANIYLSNINQSLKGLIKTATFMQLSPVSILKRQAVLSRKQATDFLEELATNGDIEALELIVNLQNKTDEWNKYKFFIQKDWNDFLTKLSNNGSTNAMHLLITDILNNRNEYCTKKQKAYSNFQTTFTNFKAKAPLDSIISVSNKLANIFYSDLNWNIVSPNRCEKILWELGIKTINDFAINDNKKAKEVLANFNRLNKGILSENEVFNRKVENGFAKVFYNKKSFYEGEFKNGQRSGKGYLKYENENRYEGDFLNDKFHGKGTFTYGDNGQMVSDFINGLPTGIAKLTWPNGSYYVGEFNGYNLHGKGKIYNKDGTLHFEGNHLNNKRSGLAKLYYNDTKETLICFYNYLGEFEGKGTFTKPNNYKKTAQWINNKWNELKYFDPKGNSISESEYNKN